DPARRPRLDAFTATLALVPREAPVAAPPAVTPAVLVDEAPTPPPEERPAGIAPWEQARALRVSLVAPGTLPAPGPTPPAAVAPPDARAVPRDADASKEKDTPALLYVLLAVGCLFVLTGALWLVAKGWDFLGEGGRFGLLALLTAGIGGAGVQAEK